MTEKRTMPIKVEKFQLNGAYQGFEFEARTNPPWGTFIDTLTALEKEDPKKTEEILERLYDLVELVIGPGGWNFVDEKGKPIPATREGFRKLPLDLIHLVIGKARQAIEAVPLSFNEE